MELRLGGFTIGLGTVEAAKPVHGVEAESGRPSMVLVLWTDGVDTQPPYRSWSCTRRPPSGAPRYHLHVAVFRPSRQR